ncbi:unnamed protein product [Mesocestoides corti]|uniref:Phospholipase A-2-activating protein n=1 Tax=Mesocestoides corti TaxID=53468 RepID=A0A158QS82_MESCO|nr:unnamed protein product [Mesocestoides corti]
MSTFKFRNELCGHTSDVRSLCSPSAGVIVSASRDLSVRSWKLDEATPNAHQGKEYEKHENYVTTVIYAKPTEFFPRGLILTGSNDRLIRAFTDDQPEPIFILHGHTDTGTGATIWAVLFLPTSQLHPDEYLVATGSSDSVVAIWRIPFDSLNPGSASFESSKPARILAGHTDCVRSLALLDSSRLISASNDGSLRCWSIASGTCLAEFYGHTNFVYSVAVDPGAQFIASSGEDRTVRVWTIPADGVGYVQQMECEQTLFLPCQTVWCVAITADGDIAVGCRQVTHIFVKVNAIRKDLSKPTFWLCSHSDAKIRLFSRKAERQATGTALETYEAELASSKMAAGTLGEVDKHALPGVEALCVPGRNEGQVMVIREDAGVVCYQWSARESRWVKVGDVVGSIDDSATGSNRTLFEGREYDYVFTVDFDENAPPVKLPYNKTDDPWHVAQAFLFKHNLPQDYLDTVANYIIKNAGLDKSSLPSSVTGGFSDPFTGSGRYVPGGSSGHQSNASGANAADYFPAKECITLETTNVQVLLRKLVEFNSSASKPLPDRALQIIEKMSPEMPDHDALYLTQSILDAIAQWPAETAFPLFDLLRCLVRWSSASEAIFQPDAWACVSRVSGLQGLLESSTASEPPPTPAQVNCLLFTFRLMTNAIAIDGSRPDIIANVPASLPLIIRLASKFASLITGRRIDAFFDKKGHQVAVATLIFNLSTFAHLHQRNDNLVSILPALRGLPGLCTRMAISLLSYYGTEPGVVVRCPPEVPLRLLRALGTAIVTSIPETAEDGGDAVTKLKRTRLIGSAAAASAEEDPLAGWNRFRDVLGFWAKTAAVQPATRGCANALMECLSDSQL